MPDITIPQAAVTVAAGPQSSTSVMIKQHPSLAVAQPKTGTELSESGRSSSWGSDRSATRLSSRMSRHGAGPNVLNGAPPTTGTALSPVAAPQAAPSKTQVRCVVYFENAMECS